MMFEARIVEHFSRRVLVEATDEDEARTILEGLCAEGTINLDYDDFNDRDIEIVGSKSKSSWPYLEKYNRNGEM